MLAVWRRRCWRKLLVVLLVLAVVHLLLVHWRCAVHAALLIMATC